MKLFLLCTLLLSSVAFSQKVLTFDTMLDYEGQTYSVNAEIQLHSNGVSLKVNDTKVYLEQLYSQETAIEGQPTLFVEYVDRVGDIVHMYYIPTKSLVAIKDVYRKKTIILYNN